jgi:hypothetical protein
MDVVKYLVENGAVEDKVRLDIYNCHVFADVNHCN